MGGEEGQETIKGAEEHKDGKRARVRVSVCVFVYACVCTRVRAVRESTCACGAGKHARRMTHLDGAAIGEVKLDVVEAKHLQADDMRGLGFKGFGICEP